MFEKASSTSATSSRPITWASTPSAMGVIIAVVAVLDTHIDSSAVAIMIARMSSRADAPIRNMIHSAIRRSIPYFWRAFASMNPAMNRKMSGSANPYSAGASWSYTPNPVSTAGIDSAVTASGSARVTHRKPAKNMVATAYLPVTVSPSGVGDAAMATIPPIATANSSSRRPGPFIVRKFTVIVLPLVRSFR